jgi:1-deoxy-D-xylulose-5-phosphate reductoisomerase
MMAQMGTPDMALPIQYALTYPKRVKGIANHLKLEKLGSLTFSKPDMKIFRSLALGFEVAKMGGSAPVVFNAANEIAVQSFLAGQIRFAEIVEIIEKCLNKHNVCPCVSIEELLDADAWARREVTECLRKI